MEYETVVGLEVHVQLKTKSKAFCGCAIEFGSPANTLTCPVCLGLPGSLPALNKTALDYAVRAGLALSCQIQEFTKFDRKHYYYPDLPKNYQISQYDLPVCWNGSLEIEAQGKIKLIRIKRVHLEEDAGKLIHQDDSSLLDLNRAGIPLLEIVTEPDISSPQEAYDYLTALKSIIEYLEISDCDMEKGSLRCDANISIREKGAAQLGIKAELKNMNSFKGVKEALAFEIQRQTNLLESGQKVAQETRLWDTKELKTRPMRTKEEAKDYRYFPEPDLPPFIISQEKIEEARKTIPELPKDKLKRFINEYNNLSEDAAKILVASKKDAEFAEQIFRAYPDKDKKPAANWLIGPLASIAGSASLSISEVKIPGGIPEFIKLINLEKDGSISNLTAKSVLSESVAGGALASKIIQEKNLFQVSDPKELDGVIEEVLKANQKSVDDYNSGKINALMFLVGQVMKKSGGKANPKAVQEMLKKRFTNA